MKLKFAVFGPSDILRTGGLIYNSAAAKVIISAELN